MISWQKIAKIPNYIVIQGVLLYRALLSPSVGALRYIPFYPKPSCIFHPTCSEYAILAFKKYSFLVAGGKTIKRISKCHPGNLPETDYP